ncbi:probable protein phosphatase 2C 55 isoform X1 [Tripterygium wilfordii]|uniref:probable protein phosphatase 2C 55 isoform X1 n=1 Tax=Tripterygium wilfordii TaxID=458696 RepID=UPI0018F7F9A6|nr:probable protein phosphatase 2C 55 isoform X1 [Tripterygium wilfordii]XP_038716099.1 probable protein phosphatase 2C 55 isoform X1 [Tripterygium wilfordii]XP_038716100.1 probable protein phosphatase 2C 55 isoform X1 [Tripterygium wilfordii]
MPSDYFMNRLRSVVQNGVQRSVLRQEVGQQVSVEVLLGQGKSWFFNHRSFNSACFSKPKDLHVLLQPGTGFPARPDSLIVNRRRNISVVGAVSRPFSVPSVSGPTFQVCGYHIDHALREHSEFSGRDEIQNKRMSACGPRAVLVQYLDASNLKHGDLPWSADNASLLHSNKSFSKCRKASMCLKNHNQLGNTPIFRYMMYNIAKRWCDFSPYTESGLRCLHGTSRSCFSAETAPDVSFDNSVREEQLASSTISSDQKISSGKSLKLLSGSCYLPHPDKEETGGEDAHFICDNKQAIGVADGVGGWADLGIDAGIYSRELMSNSVNAIEEEVMGSIDPARILEKAHSSTKAKGSSTACIVALTDQQGLQAINLGDSGFMVVRDGCTIFRSPVQQHNFNFTYQLESGDNGALPSSGQVFTVAVAPGDVIVAGTDGLFDNLYNNEITAVVVHAVRAGLGPQVTAQKMAALARQRAQDKDRQTPFSTAAQDAGFRYYGGKLDDITVVVSYVTSSNEEKKSCS